MVGCRVHIIMNPVVSLKKNYTAQEAEFRAKIKSRKTT